MDCEYSYSCLVTVLLLVNLFQVIDLTSVSQELAYLAGDADLVILEGMVSFCNFTVDLAVYIQFLLICSACLIYRIDCLLTLFIELIAF